MASLEGMGEKKPGNGKLWAKKKLSRRTADAVQKCSQSWSHWALY
jgi:hypothetical protein